MQQDLQLLCKRYSLFRPKGKENMKDTYPELADYPPFKSLDREDMKFVWLMRCEASPFADTVDEKKWEECVDIAYHRKASRKKEDYKNLNFPEEIRKAFDQMSVFELSHRVKMLMSCEAAMNQMMENLHKGDADPEKFAKMSKDSIAAMREISAFIEKGNFGVTEEPEDQLADLREELTKYHKDITKESLN